MPKIRTQTHNKCKTIAWCKNLKKCLGENQKIITHCMYVATHCIRMYIKHWALIFVRMWGCCNLVAVQGHNNVHFDRLRFFSFWLSGFWACLITRTKSWNAFSTFNLCFALASTYLTCMQLWLHIICLYYLEKVHTDLQLLCYLLALLFRYLCVRM